MNGAKEAPSQMRSAVIKRFLTIFLPLAALMGGILYHTEVKTARTVVESNEVYNRLQTRKSNSGSDKAFESGAVLLEAKAYFWKIVSHVSPDFLNARSGKLLGRFLLLFTVLILLLGTSSRFLAHASVSRMWGMGPLSKEYQSPLHILLIVATSIFVAETLVMFLLPPLSKLAEAFVDSFLLVVLISPMLYVFLFRPLVLHITERKYAEEALQKAKDDLEIRVKERTSELSSANEQLRLEISERRRAQEALREQEKKQRMILKNINEIVYMLSMTEDDPFGGTIQFVSLQVKNIIGYQPAEFLNDRTLWTRLLHPDDIPAMEQTTRKVLASKRGSTREFRLRHKRTGGYRWMEDRVVPQFDCSGKVTGIFGVARDITERKRTEEGVRLLQIITQAISESEDFHSALEVMLRDVCDFTSWSFGEAWIPGADGTVLECSSFWSSNTKGLEEFRRLSEEFKFPPGIGLPGRVWSSKQTEWISDVSNKPDTFFLRTQIAAAAGLKAGLGIPIIADDQVLAVLVFFMFESHQEDERLVGMISTFVSQLGSMIQRKQAEEALQQSEARFAGILDIAPEAIISIDESQEIILFNKGAEQIFGYSSDEAVGQSLDFLLPGKFQAIHQGHVSEFAHCARNSRRMGERREIYGRRKNGEEFPAEASISKLEIDSERIFTVVLGDITERKKLEEQLRQSQKLEAVGQLTGGIAHDFNNLLTVILGNAEFGLQDSKSGDPVYQDLTRIEKAAFQARDLISQLLSFSRRQMLEPQVLNLNRTVKDLFKMLTRIIGEDIELKTKLDPELAPIWADPVHIQQVLMNLFVNARDAMPKGGQLLLETRNVRDGSDVPDQLSVNGSQAEDKSDSTGFVEITITDTGHGMDKETQARIFEPFFSTKEAGKGTGLGLSVVYGIVKQHDGHIEVFSEIAKGSTFKLYFPAASQPAGIGQKSAQLASLGGRETILVVEDAEAVRNVAVRILKELGYNVLMAEDGMQAMKVLEAESQNIDAVILDVVMPQMSGPDLYRNLSSIKPGLPAVFATGYDLRAETEDLVRTAQAPVSVLRKPYNREALGEKVREVLDRA